MSLSPRPLDLSRTRVHPDPVGFTFDDTSFHQSTDRSVDFKKPLNRLHRYIPIKIIGKGSFGTVILARKAGSSSDLVAIKVLDKLEMLQRKQQERLAVEVKCMKHCSGGPWFPKLIGCYQSKLSLFIIQEFAEGGELYFHLGNMGKLQEAEAKFVIAECILGLRFLHRKFIIYRDLKPENIMFDINGHVKLVDFGLSKMLKEKELYCNSGSLSFVGTNEYLAPEMLLKEGHGYAVDFWAAGMVLYEMLAGLPPWYSDDHKKVTNSILCDQVNFTRKLKGNSVVLLFDHYSRSFISGLLNKDPSKRIGSDSTCSGDIGFMSLQKHAYFALDENFCWNSLVSREPSIFKSSLKFKSNTSNFDEQFTSTSIPKGKYSSKGENLRYNVLDIYDRRILANGERDNVFGDFEQGYIF